MQWVIAENNRFPSASMRAPVSVIFIGSDWGWWGTLKLAALLFSMGLSDWWLLLWREGVFLTACTLGLISGTSARSNGVCVGTSGMACTFLHLLICVHVCNVKGAETSRFRHTVGCQCVCLRAMAGCTLKCVLADRVFLKDEQASVRVRQDGTLGSVEGISFLAEHGHEQLLDLCACVMLLGSSSYLCK